MRVPWRALAEAVGLAAALSFVFAMGLIPHMDTFSVPPREDVPELARLGSAAVDYLVTDERTGYPYPMHVDEHVHWVMAAGIQRHGTVFVSYPTGEPVREEGLFSLRGAVHERGFHIILAETQELTGVSFQRVFQFLPAAWLAFTAFAMYAVLRPSPAAIPAAAFVGLIPTTVRFLGPGFLVPIGFVLAWMPVTLILAEPARKKASCAALLLLVVSWAFFVHLIGGFAAVALLLFGAVVGSVRERRALLALLAAALLPLLAMYRAFTEDVKGELNKEEILPIDFTIFDSFGIPALALWGLGVALLFLLPPRHRRTSLVGLSLFSVAVFALILAGVVFEWGRYATYARWHPPFFLAAAAPLGYAVATAASFLFHALRRAATWRPSLATAAPVVAIAAGVGLVSAAVSPAVAEHLGEPYYHVLDSATYARYEWVAQNVPPEYEVVLTHPWQAPVLNALSGIEPHSWLTPGVGPERGEDYQSFVVTGGTLDLFILNDISLVVTTGKPPFDEFVELGPGVWGLRPEIAREIAEIRAMERS